MTDDITNIIEQSIEVKRQLVSDDAIINTIEEITKAMISVFRQDKKVLFCGNGGSAADALHLSAELSGRFYLNRRPLFAEALSVNTPNMTAISNDFSFEELYARMVAAKGREGDMLVAISTSGRSPNILNALKMAKKQQMITVGFGGGKINEMNELCDRMINVPSEVTPRIQEAHILIGHIICEFVERELFSAKP